MRVLGIALLCASLAACLSNPATTMPEPVATATIRTISPDGGTAVDGDSVIKAEIEYTITNFDPGAEYYLVPLFASNATRGGTFNAFDRVAEGWKLTQAAGTVQVEYPIAREWRDASLAKPVRVTFSIMVRTGTRSTRVIGGTGSVQFGAAVFPHALVDLRRSERAAGFPKSARVSLRGIAIW